MVKDYYMGREESPFQMHVTLAADNTTIDE